jgi:hypothetical protein
MNKIPVNIILDGITIISLPLMQTIPRIGDHVKVKGKQYRVIDVIWDISDNVKESEVVEVWIQEE